MSQREIEIHTSVTFDGFANGSQSEQGIFNKSPNRTRQNKQSLNQNIERFLKKVSGKGPKVPELT